jgi:hypothetical protein
VIGSGIPQGKTSDALLRPTCDWYTFNPALAVRWSRRNRRKWSSLRSALPTWRGGTVSGQGIGNYCIKNSQFLIFRANDMNACNQVGGHMADFVRLNGGTIRLDPLQ